MKFYEILHAIKEIEDLYGQSQTLSKQITHLKESKNLPEEETKIKIAAKEAELKKQLETANNAKQSLIKSVQSGEEGIDVKRAVELIESITHQLQIEYGIIPKEKDAQEKDFIFPGSIKHLEAYHKHANPAVYQSLLPFAELAYLFEKNGIPEEHAFKLSTLFGDRRKALAYIDGFATKNIKKLKRPNFYLMHDALLFGMPPARGCDFKKWCQLAQLNMHEAGFRKLLSSADVIEKAIRDDEIKAAQLRQSQIKAAQLRQDQIKLAELRQDQIKAEQFRQDQIKAAQKDLSKKISKWKKLKGQHSKTKQDPKKDKEYQTLTDEISEDRVKLAELYAGTPWSRSSYEMIRAYYERYTMQTSGVFRSFIAHGLTRQDYYEKFLNLRRENAGRNMPKITKAMAGAVVSKTKDDSEQCVIDGAFYGFPGFYMKQINARNDIEAAQMAYGGKLTKSCQSLSGEAGEVCVIDGLTSPNASFYVLCKGDAHAPKSEDEVCGLSWAWRSKENNIVFDSIEMHPDFSATQVKGKIVGAQMGQTLFTALANEMVKNSDIVGVYCGTNSGISNLFGHTGGASFNNQQFVSYNGYHDSSAQNLIAHKDYPFLLYQKLFGKEAEAYFGNSIDNFIVNCLDKGNIKAIQNLIEFSIANDFLELNQRVIKICGEKHPDKLKALENYSHLCTRCFVLLDRLDEERFGKMDEKEKKASLSEMMGLFKEGLNPNIRNIGGVSPLLIFLKNKAEKEFIDILIKNEAQVNTSDIHGNSPLMIALSKRADNAIIMTLLNNGANVNQADRNGATPLLIAINKGDKAIVEVLLERGANVNYAGGTIHGVSITPLIMALNYSRNAIVEVLLANGADVNQPDGYGSTPLMVALRAKVDKAILDAILAKTEDINQCTVSGGSALLYALEENYDDAIIAVILAKGADVNRVGTVGLRGSATPLILALKKGKDASKTTIDALLAKGANVNQANEKGITPLMVALKEKVAPTIIETLLAKGADVTKTELELAKISDVNQEITVLLESAFKKYQENQIQAQIQAQVQECITQAYPLHYALQRNFNQSVIMELLKRGVDINQKGDIGQTALSEAAQRADQASVELLVTHKATIDLSELLKSRDHPETYSYLKERASPDVLLLDALQTNADQAVIEDLLKKGANPNYEANFTSALPTALTLTPTRDIIQLLIRYGAKVDNAALHMAKDLPEIYPLLVKHELARKQRLGERLVQPYPLLIAMWNETSDAEILALIEQCEEVNRQDEEGHTPLLEALRYKPRMEIISALLEKGADVNLPDKEGNSPLTIALDRKLDISIITKLLNAKGIRINQVHENGQPLLYSAIERADSAIIRLLLEKGADPNLRNSFNQSLLEYSFYCHADEETIGLLLKHGVIVNEEILDKAKFFTSEAIQALLKKHMEEMAQAKPQAKTPPASPTPPPLRFSVPVDGKEEVANEAEVWNIITNRVNLTYSDMESSTAETPWDEPAKIVIRELKTFCDQENKIEDPTAALDKIKRLFAKVETLRNQSKHKMIQDLFHRIDFYQPMPEPKPIPRP